MTMTSPPSSLTELLQVEDGTGYPTELFLCPVHDYECPLCLSVCRDAFSSGCCGRLLCHRCLQRWQAQDSSAIGRCPACGSASSSSSSLRFAASAFADRLIRSLPIRCPRQCSVAGLTIGTDERVISEHLNKLCSQRNVEGELMLCPQGCYEPQPSPLQDPSSSSPLSSPCFYPTPSRASEAEAKVRQWAVGMHVDAQDGVGDWLVAQVKVLRGQGEALMLQVGYLGWPSKWDEWIRGQSARIAPLQTHTTPISLARQMRGRRPQITHSAPQPAQSGPAIPRTQPQRLPSASSSFIHSSTSSSSSSSSASSSPSPSSSPVALVPTRVPRHRLLQHLTQDCPYTVGDCSDCHVQLRRFELAAHRLTAGHSLQRLQLQVDALTKAVLADSRHSAAAAELRASLSQLQARPQFDLAAAAAQASSSTKAEPPSAAAAAEEGSSASAPSAAVASASSSSSSRGSKRKVAAVSDDSQQPRRSQRQSSRG